MYDRSHDMLWYSSQVQGKQAANVLLDIAMGWKGRCTGGNHEEGYVHKANMCAAAQHV